MDEISIRDVVELYGIRIKPGQENRRNVMCQCPFCDPENKYRMGIDFEKNMFHCFHCGESGGYLDLYGLLSGTPHRKGTDGNGKELYKELAGKVLTPSASSEKKVKRIKREYADESRDIKPAADDRLNIVYTVLLDIPAFKLTEEHRQKLLKRGLNDETIRKNGYRSVRDDFTWADESDKSLKRYFYRKLNAECKKQPLLKHMSGRRLFAEFLVGLTVSKKVGKPAGVPGFYKVANEWFFRLLPGMLIPTRNQKGEIVAMQVRTDKGDTRYLTVSSSGLPEGVNTGIARVHFPLGNEPVENVSKVLLTEGPLKSDVACFLEREISRKGAYFIAIPGVHNTKYLPELFDSLRKAGVSKLVDCFDMDKLTNPYVAKARNKISVLAREHGLQYVSRYWAQDFAAEKLDELCTLCEEHSLPIPFGDNVFSSVASVARYLEKEGVRHSVINEDGEEKKHYWSDDSKGIDDYLLCLYEKRKRNAEDSCGESGKAGEA